MVGRSGEERVSQNWDARVQTIENDLDGDASVWHDRATAG